MDGSWDIPSQHMLAVNRVSLLPSIRLRDKRWLITKHQAQKPTSTNPSKESLAFVFDLLPPEENTGTIRAALSEQSLADTKSFRNITVCHIGGKVEVCTTHSSFAATDCTRMDCFLPCLGHHQISLRRCHGRNSRREVAPPIVEARGYQHSIRQGAFACGAHCRCHD